MSSSVLEYYQISEQNFPLTVYRVHYPGSQTTYSPQRGFEAASNFTPYRVNGLRNAVKNHLNWGFRVYKSPFISTFGNKWHAESWARKWRKNNGYQPCYITVITIDEEDGVMVFDVVDLVNRLGIVTSYECDSEYLCFHRIPSEVIVRSYQV
jgi:hypothetical protein